jgi:hypothetical protein
MKGFGKLGIWACGVLFGTAGISILKSEDAKTVYTHVTAAAKRGGRSGMETYTALKENIDDISADADDINEARARKKEEREIADARAKLEAYEAKAEQ